MYATYKHEQIYNLYSVLADCRIDFFSNIDATTF